MSIFSQPTSEPFKPVVGFFGKSGSGKTYSALLLARGIAGPDGKIGLIDTENRRGSIYKNDIPGGYMVHDFDPPFHPIEYVKKIRAAHEEGVRALVIDSATHEWGGEGGYLDLKEQELQRMCGDDWRKRDMCAGAAAARVKPKTHMMFINEIIRSPMPIILCLRAKEKFHMGKEGGKTVVGVDDAASAIQDNELIFEMLFAAEIEAREGDGGYFSLSSKFCKKTHHSIPKLLAAGGERISIKHGELLRQWCLQPGWLPGSPVATPAPKNTIAAAKKRLWELTEIVHEGKKDALVEWLKFVNLFTKPMEELTEPEIEELIIKAAPLLPKA
jgi:hypothetical protein